MRSLLLALALVAAVPSSETQAALCRGDCNGDGEVLDAELVTAAGIDLLISPYRLCPSADGGGDGAISVEDLVASTASRLGACPDAVTSYSAPALTETSGPREEGRGVLPNGRTVAPAGVQIP